MKNDSGQQPDPVLNNQHRWKIAAIGIPAAIILVIVVIFFFGQPQMTPDQLEPLTIASGSGEFSALTLIADEKGYFEKHGLNVTIRDHFTGVGSINDLLAGNADLSYASEIVGVSTSFRPEDFRIIASTAKSNEIKLVIRNDRGITQPSDLRGKTIAFPKGTAAEFYLGRYLMINGMDIDDVTVSYLSPAELSESIENGNSDAVIIWEPWVYQITQKLGQNVTAWPAQGGQNFYWVTYTQADVIRDKPELIRQYLRAIDDAQLYLHDNEPEGKEIVRLRLNLTDDYMETMWEENQFVLSLDQGIIVAMEDEARWMTKNNLTGGTTPPSYLDMIDQDAMREVKPQAVSIIR